MKRINIRRAAFLQLFFVPFFYIVAPESNAQREPRKTNRTTSRAAKQNANRIASRAADRAARVAAADKAARTTTDKARATAQTHLSAGLEHHQGGRYKEAVASLNRAISLAPSLPSAHYNLGLAHEKSGKYIEALKAFERAARLDPADADAHSRLGAMQNYFGMHKEAVTSLRQAIRLRPNVASDHNILASALFRLGRYAEAATTLENSLRISPDAATYENLAGAYQKLGRTADALSAKQNAVRLNSQRTNLARVAPQPVAAAETERTTSRRLIAQRPAGQSDAPQIVAQQRPAPPRATPQARTAADLLPVAAISTPNDAPRIEERAGARLNRTPVVEPRRENGARRTGESVAPATSSRASATTDDAPQRARNTQPPANTASPSNAEPRRAVARTNRPPQTSTTISVADVPTNSAMNASPTAVPAQPTPTAVEVAAEVEPAKTNAVPVAPAKTDSANVESTEPEPAVTQPANATPTPREPTNTAPTKSTTATAEPSLTSTYRVGIGDILDVRLLNAPAAGGSTLYTVLAGGLLDYPLAGGAVPVAGLEPKEIAAQLAARIKLFDAPEVVVSVREYASHTVAVNGLVANPGTKVLRQEAVPLYVLLADAQPRPEAGRAVLLSPASGETRTIALDDHEALNTLVRPNDVVTVQARAPQFYYISGEVNDPGEKALRPNTTLTQAVLAAGIFSRLPSEVQISRKTADGTTVVTKYNLKHIRAGRTPDPALQPGDWVEVVQ